LIGLRRLRNLKVAATKSFNLDYELTSRPVTELMFPYPESDVIEIGKLSERSNENIDR